MFPQPQYRNILPTDVLGCSREEHHFSNLSTANGFRLPEPEEVPDVTVQKGSYIYQARHP